MEEPLKEEPMTAELIGTTRGSRIGSAFFDHLLALVLVMVVGLIVTATGLPTEIAILFAIPAYIFYFVLPEARWGQTLGKKLFGLMVLKTDGTRIGWLQAWLRFAARIIEVNPALLGGLPALLVIVCSRKHQRLGDMMAGTVVVALEDVVFDGEDDDTPMALSPAES